MMNRRGMLCNYKIQLPTEAPLAGKLLGNHAELLGEGKRLPNAL